MCDKKGLVIISSNNYNRAWLKCHLLAGVFCAVVRGGASSSGALWELGGFAGWPSSSAATVLHSCL